MHGLLSLLTSALLLAPVLFAQQGSANAQGAQKPRVVSSFTAEAGARYPFRQNMYRALLLSDGRLVAVSIARENRQQTMQGRYSTDNGQTWSGPEDFFKFPIEAGGFGLFEAMVDQEGEIHIFFLCDANSGVLFPKEGGGAASGYGTLEIWHVRSKDKLKGWGALKRIREGRNSDLLSVTQLSNGRIVSAHLFRHRQDLARSEGKASRVTPTWGASVRDLCTPTTTARPGTTLRMCSVCRHQTCIPMEPLSPWSFS